MLVHINRLILLYTKMNHNLCCWHAKKRDTDMLDLFDEFDELDEGSRVDWDRIPRIDMILDYIRGNFNFVNTYIPQCRKLFNLPYFYNNMSTQQAIDLLINQQSGSFLVRKMLDPELETNKIFISFNCHGKVGHIQDFTFDSKLLTIPLVISHHHVYWNARKPYLKEEVSFAMAAKIRQLRLKGVLDVWLPPDEMNTFVFCNQINRKNPFTLLTLCKSVIANLIPFHKVTKLQKEIPLKLIHDMQNELGISRMIQVKPAYLFENGYDPDYESGDE